MLDLLLAITHEIRQTSVKLWQRLSNERTINSSFTLVLFTIILFYIQM